jgi:hypothetical protein
MDYMSKDEVVIEKEVIIKEVRGEKMEKTTIRIFITTEGKTRSIVFTPAKFNKFRKEVNQVKF